MSLGQFLRSCMSLSKKEISRAKFLENGICVEGVRRKVTAVLEAGEFVEVQLETGERTSLQLGASDKELEVLYEDEDVIVLNKPAGLSVHPAGRGTFHGDTLANRLAFYLREKGEDCVIRILGRLDKDTSGVVLAAKSRTASARLEPGTGSGRQNTNARMSGWENGSDILSDFEDIPCRKRGWNSGRRRSRREGRGRERKGSLFPCPSLPGYRPDPSDTGTYGVYRLSSSRGSAVWKRQRCRRQRLPGGREKSPDRPYGSPCVGACILSALYWEKASDFGAASERHCQNPEFCGRINPAAVPGENVCGGLPQCGAEKSCRSVSKKRNCRSVEQ